MNLTVVRKAEANDMYISVFIATAIFLKVNHSISNKIDGRR